MAAISTLISIRTFEPFHSFKKFGGQPRKIDAVNYAKCVRDIFVTLYICSLYPRHEVRIMRMLIACPQ